MYDVVVVGGGPAGLTAALYTSRRTLKTLILAKDLGGQMAATNDIENYPGFEQITGFELAQKMKAQAEKFGSEFKMAGVNKIAKKEDGNFIITFNKDETVEAQSVILSFGLTPRNLDVPGEEDYQGKGVTYCANCDAPLYKGKDVAVVGGGNSALDAADLLSRIANKVYLIHRRDKFRGEEVMVQEVLSKENVEVLYNTEVKEIKGEQLVTGLVTKDEKTLDLQGVFIEVGRIAHTEWLTDVVDLNEKKEIIVDTNGNTSTEGIFAAGDVTNVSQKQIAVATGEGVKASLACYTYLLTKKGESIPGVDWGKKE